MEKGVIPSNKNLLTLQQQKQQQETHIFFLQTDCLPLNTQVSPNTLSLYIKLYRKYTVSK